jgi:cell division cycle 14
VRDRLPANVLVVLCACSSVGNKLSPTSVGLHLLEMLESNESKAPEANKFECPQCHHIFGRVYLAEPGANFTLAKGMTPFVPFTINGIINYFGFEDDFGPMNLGSTFEFCGLLDCMLEQNADVPVVMACGSERGALTNSVYLLGAHMIMRLNYALQDVQAACGRLLPWLEGYCDVSPMGEDGFRLLVQDCWGGLVKAKALKWVDFGPDGFDLEEYTTFDDPLNADLHEIVPGKFVAMRGPITVADGQLWHDAWRNDGTFSHREFSPAHYADILQQFDVQAVVRLNAPQYDKGGFHAAGIAVADLFFEDCTTPPVDVVAKFFAIAEALPGALAVHCKAGLGRTGTLIALYMMKHHGFTAREAMGWLRVVRPGSVIGEQQAFLCAREPLMRRSCAPLRPRVTAAQLAAATAGDAAAVEELIATVVADYDASYAAALRINQPAVPRSVPARCSSSPPARAGADAALASLAAAADCGCVGGGVGLAARGGVGCAAPAGAGDADDKAALERSASPKLAEHVSAAMDRRATARVAHACAAKGRDRGLQWAAPADQPRTAAVAE